MNETILAMPTHATPSLKQLFGLVAAECDLAVQATNALAGFLDTGNKDAAETVRNLERQADSARAAGTSTLRSQFADSPLREDISRAINRVHEIVHYASTSVRELELLGVEPDEHLRNMAVQLRTGARAVEKGFSRLADGVKDVTMEVEQARKSERDAEEAYRQALAKLFDPRAFIRMLDDIEHKADTRFLGHYLREQQNQHGAAARGLAHVVDIFRKREVLRHMSNAADRVLYASDILGEIAAEVSLGRT